MHKTVVIIAVGVANLPFVESKVKFEKLCGQMAQISPLNTFLRYPTHFAPCFCYCKIKLTFMSRLFILRKAY